jgi:hypothetical protein
MKHENKILDKFEVVIKNALLEKWRKKPEWIEELGEGRDSFATLGVNNLNWGIHNCPIILCFGGYQFTRGSNRV